MMPALITAFGVGGATILGALIGFAFKKISHKFNDIILSFAAGIMLAAAVIGLILPSLELENSSIIITVIGIFAGAFLIALIDKLTPHVHNPNGDEQEMHMQSKLSGVTLFVIAIAIHNFPEGLAAGVGFGSENIADAITVAIGIALQNIPEGIVIIAPMLACGMSKRKTFIIAALTGVVEIVGTIIGYLAASVSEFILPFALAFAGGTMLYVISDEMIPETHAHGSQRGATYALLVGFCVMLVTDYLLG